MPSLFGKSHLYRYDIQGGAKSHYLVFVHLPCLHTQLKQFSHLSLFPLNEYDQETIECLMNHNSLTTDCLNYLFQRLQIREKSLYPYFGLTYFNKTNNQCYWLDPDLPMRQQIPKAEIKPNLTFTFLICPTVPHAIQDDKARLILYQQLFCNFISSSYSIPKNVIEHVAAYFLAGCFPKKFHPEKNRDVLRLILSAVGLSEDNSDEKILEFYRDLNGIDTRSAQDQFVYQISQTNQYGMIYLELKNSLNEAVCLGLNHHGIHSRSLLRNEFKLEVCWHTITSIATNKQRQITLIYKNGTTNLHSLIYYTDSSSYNRYCLRLFNLFYNHFSKYSTTELENIPKLQTPMLNNSRLLHGVSVPDLRSDGESSSNDRTPPSISSSTHSSNRSANLWKGSLPNLTVQLSTRQSQTTKSRDPYATYADHLNQIDTKESVVPTMTNQQITPPPLPRRSVPIALKSQSPVYLKDSTPNSPSTVSTTSRSLLNSRTYLSSTSVPLEPDSISVHNDTQTDTWVTEFESKISSNIVYDEFDAIPLARMNCSIQDGRLSDNAHRNRFTDVIPYDDTRVRLIPTKENLHGYINASHVKIRIENTIYSYIAAESPLPLTVYDFWRMVSGSNVHVIVMLLGNDLQCCANYFPRSKTDKCRTDEFEIELLSEQNRQDFHIRHLKMKFLNGQRTRTVVHLQYTAWDDAQLPLDTGSFLNFINVANSFRRHYGETNPCLVHCTAGIGRTGIFIIVHVMIQCITFNKKVSLASVLKVMREHRMSLIDRTYSYVFVYRCLIDYLKSSRLI